MCGNIKIIIISNYKTNKYIIQYYNKLLYKHLKIITIMEILQKIYYFFKMKHYVTKYITKYIQCQRNEYLIHSIYNKI